MQAVVDAQGRFIDVYGGWPGSVHDSRVFSTSPLYQKLHNGEMLQEPVVVIEGEPITPYIVGDAGYKLESFLIVPYPGRDLPSDKERFNHWHSSTRMIVEQAFGRLKGRFRLLNGTLYIRDPVEYATIIGVGCILHNLMMDMNDIYDVTWVRGVRLRTSDQVFGEGSRAERVSSGSQVRNLLCAHVNRKNQPR